MTHSIATTASSIDTVVSKPVENIGGPTEASGR